MTAPVPGEGRETLAEDELDDLMHAASARHGLSPRAAVRRVANRILAAHAPPAPADREGPAGGLSEVIYDVLRGAGHGQCEGQDEPLDVTAARIAARLAAVRAPDAGLRAAKAEAWDEAHTQFCPWVRGFSGCTSHENPHRGEYTRAALATEDGA